MSVRTIGAPEDLGLAGLPTADGPADIYVLLGGASAPADADPARVVRLAAAGTAGSSDRVVAPAGDGLWRRAPWPAADDLLAAPRAPSDAPALVIGDRAGSLAARLRERGLGAADAARLDRDGLLDAGVVVFTGAPGRPLPAHAAAVLAAGRVLVTPQAEPAFGLLAGVDHLAYRDDDEAVQLADIALTHPDALESIRAMGRVAARAQLASEVYARWAIDLELGL